MLRINVGWSDERESHQIVLGLEEGNLVRMKERKDPVVVTSESLQVKDGITDESLAGFFTFVIFATGKSQKRLEKDLEATLKLCCIEPEDKISVLNMDNSFYVAPIPSGDRVWYFIGLHGTSYRRLRDGQILQFRARIQRGGGLSIETKIFWGKNLEKLANEFRANFGKPKPR